MNFTVCSDIMITVDRGNRDRRCKRHDFKEVCLMLALLGGLAGLAASATGTLVSTAIPVIGGHLAAGAATIGAAAGAGAVGLGASAAGGALVSGATTTACNAATLTAAHAVKESMND